MATVWEHERCKRDKDNDVLVGDLWYIKTIRANNNPHEAYIHVAVRVLEVKNDNAEVTPLNGCDETFWVMLDDLVLPRVI